MLSSKTLEHDSPMVFVFFTVIACFFYFVRPGFMPPAPQTDKPSQLLFPKNLQHYLSNPDAKAVLGIDVSHYQGVVDWQQVAQAGVQFVYIKATDGITYRDPDFYSHFKGAQAAGLKVGAYHFFEPDDDPIKQVDNFVTTVQGLGLTLMPMLDVEITSNRSSQQISSGVAKFIAAVEKRIGCQTILYSYGDYWQQNLSDQFANQPFWLADYADSPSVPEQAHAWWLWQYSDSARVAGVQTQVDIDVVIAGESGLAAMKCTSKGAKS
ncbi:MULTISPECIES: glycoside hydrolase family 25 protein [unclassified Pseudoalteromonas]|uniref:glycoside hydrolase family 25 protein n=1 Tax=unclassified Pseudoalteromonas TaxID=194690 RepID=UPI002097A606|nr:glycoside hydrolase family 25 protein [Pseudoalteromonas sp. XMcav2-N]MCO7190649.1 glycoside hydrolase family 25 protein [Pseudoalteromonas sp. XMcav2-N]